MGKLVAHDTITTRPTSLNIRQIAGWSWYCVYHDTYGIGDDEDEVLYMAGAHMHYFRISDDCDIVTKEHLPDKEET